MESSDNPSRDLDTSVSLCGDVTKGLKVHNSSSLEKEGVGCLLCKTRNISDVLPSRSYLVLFVDVLVST